MATQGGGTQCPRCLIKHFGWDDETNFCSSYCFEQYDGRSLCPQCGRPTPNIAGKCESCQKRDKKFAEAVEPKRKPCVEDRCNYPREPGWLRCTLHSGNQGKKWRKPAVKQGRCNSDGCRYNRKPGFILCSTHLDAIIEVNNRHVAISDEPKKGPVMTTQTYAKDVLLGYARDKIEKFEEVIEDHADNDVAVLRQLVKDVEDDKVEKNNLVEEFAHRQRGSKHDLHTKHDGVDVYDAQRHLKLLNRLVRRLEAIDGDSLELTDNELNEMGIV